MPRVYKGSETILKLLIDVPSTSVIDKIKIALFTTDRSIAMEFYADSITLYGNIAYLNAPEWTFMEMQDGIIKYIAQGESDNKPFIFERQSNYILKTSDGFEMSEIMNGYYTKEETDVKLEAEQDKLVSGKTIKTINGESILGEGDITIEGGSGDGSSAIIVEGSNYYTINPSQFEDAYNNNIPAFYKDTKSFFPVIITKGKSEKFEAYCLLENKQLVRWKWSSGVESTSAVIEDIVDNNSVKYVSITKFNKLLYADVEDAYTNEKLLYVRLRTTTTKPYKYTTIPFSIIRDEENLNYQIFGVYSYNPFSIISATIADGEANFSDYTITEVSGGSGDSYTKAEIDGMIGDINNILTSI